MADVFVAESKIHGVGVFAARGYTKGETILVIDDSRIVDDEHPLSPEHGEHEYHCDYLGGGKVVHMQPPERHINSSCDPNTCVRTINGIRHVVALRAIKNGEELTYDYIIDCHGGIIWQCVCGSSRCRGTIVSSFFELPLRLQLEYLPLVNEWFVEEHLEEIEALRCLAAGVEDAELQIQNPKSKIQQRTVDGILIIDKPAGLTSHDVVARVRRILRERKVGHTGTLDPFATGVLVLLVGRATRLAQFLASADKEYEAVIRFGYATDTGDATGALRAALNMDEPSTAQPSMDWSEGEIETALARLRGETRQIPPMYSAKKVKGQKLYELARQGMEIERESVVINVSELEAVHCHVDGGIGRTLLQHNEDGTCDLSVRVVCSAGTYVRVLAEGIGEGLGVGAHLAALRRTRAGKFSLTEAITLEELEEMAREGAATSRLFSLNAALSCMPAQHLTGEDARRVRNGVAVRAAAETTYVNDQPVRLVDEQGDLIAVAFYKAETEELRPRVVLAPEK